MTAAEQRPAVADVIQAALAFVRANGLDLPKLEVFTNGPGTRGWDPQEARPASIREAVPVPPGAVTVAFVRSGPAFVGWCRALGASRVCVDRGRPNTTRVWVNVWRDGISWSVVGLLDHEHGAPHLPGAGVEWSPRPDRNLGAVSVDGLASVYAADAAERFDASDLLEALVEEAEGDCLVLGGADWWVTENTEPGCFTITHDDTGEAYRVELAATVRKVEKP